VIDISVPNRPGMHGYPGDPTLSVEQVRSIEAGNPCNLSLLTMGSHTSASGEDYSYQKSLVMQGKVGDALASMYCTVTCFERYE